MLDVEINGTRLAYTEEGQGDPVVFVHGGMNDLRSWRRQMEPFGAKYRAVTLSCRHYYPNEAVSDGAELRLETLADDLGAFLRALDAAPAHLVGNSSGAFVCLLLARNEPDLVRSLVLAEPPALSVLGMSVPPAPVELLKLLLRSPATAFEVVKFGATGIGPAQKAFERGDDEEGLQTFVRAVLGREAAANLTAFLNQQVHDNMRTLKAQLGTGLPAFSVTDAQQVDVPVLLVTGEHSAPVHHRIIDVLEREMPRAERLDIRNASHLMYEDQPEVFNRAVLDFLARNNGYGGGG